MSSQAVVVSVGARTPLGLCAASSAAAVRAGISRIAEHPYMIDKIAEPYSVAMERTLDATERSERIVALAASAADEALSFLELAQNSSVPFYVALPDQGVWFPPEDASRVSKRLTDHFSPRFSVRLSALPAGNAGGLQALNQAIQAIRSGRHDYAVVVGVDSHLDPDELEGLDECGRLASVSNRWGHTPGEGAGALVIASSKVARQQGLDELARVLSVGIGREENLIGTDSICIGEGLSDALGAALSPHLITEPVDAIFCDINGERYRTSEWVYASLRLPTGLVADPTDYHTSASLWGDVGAATGPLLVNLAIASRRRDRSSGKQALLWASSESGLRGATLLEFPERKNRT